MTSSNADQNHVVLPLYYFPSRLGVLRTIWTVGFLALLGAASYASWPSDPDVSIARMKVKGVRIHARPHLEVDATVALTVRVRNDDVYSMDYTGLDVVVGYRGKKLGHVRSDGGHVRAWGSSYVGAELYLQDVGLFSDVVLLLEDLAKGTVRFDTVTTINGRLGLFSSFHFPIQAKVSCEVSINTFNQTILRQNCYPQ